MNVDVNGIGLSCHKNMLDEDGKVHPLYQTLTIGAFAKQIGVARATVNRKMKSGELQPYVSINGYKYFKLSQALEYSNRQMGHVVFSLDDLKHLLHIDNKCIYQTFDIHRDMQELFHILFFKDRLTVLDKKHVDSILNTLKDTFSFESNFGFPLNFDRFIETVNIKKDQDLQIHLDEIRLILNHSKSTIGTIMSQYLINSTLTLDNKPLHDLLSILIQYLDMSITYKKLDNNIYMRLVDFLSKDIQFIIASYVGVR